MQTKSLLSLSKNNFERFSSGIKSFFSFIQFNKWCKQEKSDVEIYLYFRIYYKFMIIINIRISNSKCFWFWKNGQSYAHIECNVQIKSKFTKVLDYIIFISTFCTVCSKQIEIVDNNSIPEFLLNNGSYNLY